MSRQAGTPKTGGRQKGTPNKKTQLLSEILEARDFSILEKLIDILPSLPSEKQADVLLDLMNYQYPKRKAVEQTTVSANIHAHMNIDSLNDQQLGELHKETTKRLLGYDIDNDVQRRQRIEYLSKTLDITSDSRKITLKKKPSQG